MDQRDVRIDTWLAGEASGYRAIHLPTGIEVEGWDICDDTRAAVLAELGRRVSKVLAPARRSRWRALHRPESAYAYRRDLRRRRESAT